jgi:hypothetical protein
MIKFDTSQFIKVLTDTQKYTLGYVDGLKASESVLAEKLANIAKGSLESYLDTMASMNPEMLHHIYEWGMAGNKSGRLFNFTVKEKGKKRIIAGALRQSTSVQPGSNEPFYNKATVMESGQDVIITPRSGSVLRFYDNGQEVFTSAPVYVANPGGDYVQGSFERTTKEYFDVVFSQSVLTSVGFWKELKKNREFKRAVRSGGYNNGYKAAKRTVAKVPGGERIGV